MGPGNFSFIGGTFNITSALSNLITSGANNSITATFLNTIVAAGGNLLLAPYTQIGTPGAPGLVQFITNIPGVSPVPGFAYVGSVQPYPLGGIPIGLGPIPSGYIPIIVNGSPARIAYYTV